MPKQKRINDNSPKCECRDAKDQEGDIMPGIDAEHMTFDEVVGRVLRTTNTSISTER